jgi:hypothetical protein
MPLTCGIAGFLGAPGGRTFYREKVPAPPGRIPVPWTAVSDVKILVSFQAGTYRYRSDRNVSVSFQRECVGTIRSAVPGILSIPKTALHQCAIRDSNPGQID